MHPRRSTYPTITVLVPAYNEGKNIERIIRDIQKLPHYHIDILVIIDSKTTDNTGQIAKRLGARTLYIKRSIGKGTNIKKAIPYITGRYAIQIDADYQFIPNDIPKLVRPLENGYDVTLGTRYQKDAHVEKGSVSNLKLFGSYFLSFMTSVVVKQRITDVMAGFKAFKTEVLKDISPTVDHFGYEAELVIRASQKNYRILNVPITYKKRQTGQSNVSSFKHGLLVLGTILNTGLHKK